MNEPRVASSHHQAAATQLRRGARWRLRATVVLLSAALVAVFGVGGCYMAAVQRGATVEPLPALGALTSGGGPRFLFSINGPSRPLGVALSPAGDRIYVTESDGDRETQVYDREGVRIGALNPPGSTPTGRTPIYVAVNPTTGEVYVSDRHAGQIFTYSAAGEFVAVLDNPVAPGESWAPLALSFDQASDLLVTDISSNAQRALMLGADGAVLRRFDAEHANSGAWAYPNGVVADGQGRILLADSNNGRILVLDRTGALAFIIGRGGVGPPLGLPRGLAVDDVNRLYVLDTINHHLMIYLLGQNDAQLLVSVGEEGVGDGQFVFPNGIAIDRAGRLYIADRENNRIQVWTY